MKQGAHDQDREKVSSIMQNLSMPPARKGRKFVKKIQKKETKEVLDIVTLHDFA